MAQTWFDGIVALGEITPAGHASDVRRAGSHQRRIRNAPPSARILITRLPAAPVGPTTRTAAETPLGIDNGNPYGQCRQQQRPIRETRWRSFKGAVTRREGTILEQQLTGLVPGKDLYFPASRRRRSTDSGGVNPFQGLIGRRGHGIRRRHNGLPPRSNTARFRRPSPPRRKRATLRFYTTPTVSPTKVSLGRQRRNRHSDPLARERGSQPRL